jgi:hypothetical protein
MKRNYDYEMRREMDVASRDRWCRRESMENADN